ncbi:MAG TPA: hypothetical protein PLC54_02590 [Spirochaetales bacterium]|nr:hypothetical protein [Spirochaetales bacterium]
MSAFESLSIEIQDHLKQIAKTSGLPLNEDSYERMAAAWLEKKSIFEDTIKDRNMVEVAFFGKDEDRGALALTWSGSILNIGPKVDGIRACEYTSIGMRSDVPPAAGEDHSELSADLEIDEPAGFVIGPIKTSSPLFKIAVACDQLEPEEEEALLTQVSQNLAEDFAEVNKTVIR